MSLPQIAITGIGALCASGLDLNSACAALFKERRLPTTARRFQLEQPRIFPVFELAPGEFDDELPEHPWSRTTRLALAAAQAALHDAGLSQPDQLSRFRVGVCIGTTVGASLNNEDFYRSFKAGQEPDPEPVKRFLRGNPAEVLARSFRLQGPYLTIVNACSSGSDALAIGASWLKSSPGSAIWF